MAGLSTILRIVIQRSSGNRRLLASVVAGVIIAAMLSSSVVIYADAVRDLGLSHALRSRPVTELDLQITSSGHPARRREYELRRDLTERLINGYGKPAVRQTIRHGVSATFFLTPPGGAVPVEQSRARANFQFFEQLGEHTRLVDGRAPRAVPRPYDPANRPEIEVQVGRDAATRLNLSLGQTFDLHPYWKLDAEPVRVTISGIIEPADISEEYWLGRTDRFDMTTTSWPTYLFFTDEATFVEVLAAYLPAMDATYQTFAYVDISTIDARNAAQVEANLRAMEAAFRQDIERTSIDSTLVETIAGYRERLFFTRPPLFALMLQMVGIVLYYLVMVNTMLVERQSGEIALLKSRGAGTLQIMSIYAVEGGLIALIGLLLGPPLAAGAITLLGPTPPFAGLSDGSLLKVRLSPDAFGLAMIGVLLAWAALMWPAYRASRYSIVHYKQSIGRPPQQPVFLKYYLDLFLVVIAGLMFYQLRQRGSFVTEQLFGELSADPLLLVTPSLFMLMVALVFLRLFPLALRLISWLTRGMNGAAAPLGLWRMVRAPVHYSRLILLLILASGVGVFAAGFRATLNRSYDDRVAYQAGAGVRVEGVRETSGMTPERLVERVSAATGVQDGTPLWRGSATYSPVQFRSIDATLIGLRPEEFGRYAYWRDDFSGGSLARMLRPLRENGASSVRGPTLPRDATRAGVWVSTPLPPQAAAYSMRLTEDGGASWDYRLIGPEPAEFRPNEWQFYQVELNRPGFGRRPENTGPAPGVTVRLHSLHVRLLGLPMVSERVTVYFDDLQTAAGGELTADWWRTGFSNPTAVEEFESFSGYELMSGAYGQPAASSVSISEARARQGKASAQVTFIRQRGGQTLHGLRARDDGEPLFVLVSDTFMKEAKKRTGDDIQVYINRQYVTVRIAGSFDLFPTYTPDPTGPHLMLADLDRLLQEANSVGGGGDPGHANEVWFADTGASAPTRDQLRAAGLNIERVVSLADLRATQARDPLVAASWEGILFLSFATVLLTTALGFIVYSYLSAQTRALEFAILRTMGFSGRQIIGLVAFEQAFVILTGSLVGTLLGLPLGRLMIGYMGITETGSEVLPPLVSRVSWATVAISNGILATMFIATIAVLIMLYTRLAVHRALRMGEL